MSWNYIAGQVFGIAVKLYLLNIFILVIIDYWLYSFDNRVQFFIPVIIGYGDRMNVMLSFI